MALERLDLALKFLKRFGTGDPAAVEIGIGTLDFFDQRFGLKFEITGAGLPGLERFFSGGKLLGRLGNRRVVIEQVINLFEAGTMTREVKVGGLKSIKH